MSTSALSLSDGTKTGPKGQKQGRKDFTKGPCLPKLDLFPPSFGQGSKGPKGRHFQKLSENCENNVTPYPDTGSGTIHTPQAPKPILSQVEGSQTH